MLRKLTVLILIILMVLSTFTVAFANDGTTYDDEEILTVASSQDEDGPGLVNNDEEREFTTSRKYSFQIFIGLLIFIAIYKVYKYLKYKKR